MKMTIDDVSAIIKEAQESVNKAMEQYKIENPGVDIEMLLAEQKCLPLEFSQIRRREVDKFVKHAIKQGVKMPFDTMEMGIIAAGRKDVQNGLSEILNTINPDKPTCHECNERMEDRGRSKKKF
jgi:predicted peroxiredoxin